MSDCCKKIKVRDEEDKKNLNIRINKIIGQMNGIKKMIDDDRYCDDILIQLSAVDKSVKSLATIILDEHMRTCLVDSIKAGDMTAVDEIVDLFRRF